MLHYKDNNSVLTWQKLWYRNSTQNGENAWLSLTFSRGLKLHPYICFVRWVHCYCLFNITICLSSSVNMYTIAHSILQVTNNWVNWCRQNRLNTKKNRQNRLNTEKTEDMEKKTLNTASHNMGFSLLVTFAFILELQILWIHFILTTIWIKRTKTNWIKQDLYFLYSTQLVNKGVIECILTRRG